MLGPEKKARLVGSSMLKLVFYAPEHEALGFHASHRKEPGDTSLLKELPG